jgi:alpha-tubulin suppressor-like RCC1 family protein
VLLQVHSYLYSGDGKLFAGGDGTFGQLGCRLTENIAGVIFTNPITRKYEDEKVEKHCPVVEVEFFDERKRPVRVACGESFTVVLDCTINFIQKTIWSIHSVREPTIAWV